MDDYVEPRRKRTSSVRERKQARQRRRQQMATLKNSSFSTVASTLNNLSGPAASIFETVIRFLREFSWHLVNRTPIAKIVGGFLVLAILLFAGNYVLAGRIFPNVWAMNIALGGNTIEEAASQLVNAWHEDIKIDISMGGQTFFSVPPSELGLSIDSQATAENARAAGMSGIPFGYSIEPVITLEYGIAQSYLLNLTEQVYIPAYEAGYTWENDQLVGLQGKSGQQLDVSLSLERLTHDPMGIIYNRRFELLTLALPPTTIDPTPYLEEAYDFATKDLQLTGYDPFTNEFLSWEVGRDERTNWLIAGVNGLNLREAIFVDFIRSINDSLNTPVDPRYIDENEAIALVKDTMGTQVDAIQFRVRYRPSSYELVQGDTGFRVGRKEGLPFGLLDEANPGLDWGALAVGQQIRVPSPDELLPEEPVPHKRIVVDLDRRWMVAYDNGEMVFNWEISIGRPEAPTYPGIFQIRTHNQVAYGSGYSLCGDLGCSQWEMSWFMGIYEVFPGLMNGFHGAVLLPNGGYLDGGQTGHASTFGCVMSQNDQAQALFEWAEVGTVVEIISHEFQPKSEIGQQAAQYIQSVTA